MSQALAVADPEQQPINLISQFLGNLGFPAFIITTLFPNLFGKVSKYPRAARIFTIPLVLWLASNFLANKLVQMWRKIMSNAMSSVTITSDDFYLYTAFKSWLSKQKLMMLEKAITAQSVFYLRNKGQDGRTIEKELANNKSIVFDPQNKFQLFRHQGRFFLLTMDTKQMIHTSMDRTEMKIWCLGLTPQPIENMLLEIYDASRTSDSRTLTTIMTPHGGRQWNRRCIKPARPLSSVYLEPDEKSQLIEDMKEYLAPTTAKWYQDRGIPYRRGYLFHGSPGTGKTSLAVALAGHFRLDVYIVSLLDLEVSDSALLSLFQAVRSGVLVLLEDVDSAGLGREVAEETSVPNTSTSTLAKVNTTIAERKRAKLQSSRITLSGLLNAIDGAGAPEGHILVMTTNAPDALDEALVRPGRIDVSLEFRKAGRVQVRDIFANMYRPTPNFEENKASKTGTEQNETQAEIEERERRESKEKQEGEELERLAEKFAESVPEGIFTPAQLQDYILLRKDQPQRAVDEIADWVNKESKATSVQTNQAVEDKKKERKIKKKQKKAVVQVDGDSTKNKTRDDAGVKKEAVTNEDNAKPTHKPQGEVKADDIEQPEQSKHEETKQQESKVDINVSTSPSEPGSPSPASQSGSENEKGSEEGDTPASSVGSDEETEPEATTPKEAPVVGESGDVGGGKSKKEVLKEHEARKAAVLDAKTGLS